MSATPKLASIQNIDASLTAAVADITLFLNGEKDG
jgi:hypothetical protein